MLKRSLDIFLAGSMLVLTLPCLLILAILIKLESKGPAIFRQARMGRAFQRFELLKLRTMQCACKGSPYTLGADPRITRIGHWLRRSKIDELPQLWNVLRGDMSLVGPRPVLPELTREFSHAYKHLLTVRPGLTDPAAVKYCRETDILAAAPEPLKYFKTVVTPDKLRISESYLDRANVLTDLWVMLQTVIVLLPFPARTLTAYSIRELAPVSEPIERNRGWRSSSSSQP